MQIALTGQIINKLCSYPRRFYYWLQSQYPHVSIFEQKSTDGSLPELPILLSKSQLPDIVLVDFSVNDAVQMLEVIVIITQKPVTMMASTRQQYQPLNTS